MCFGLLKRTLASVSFAAAVVVLIIVTGSDARATMTEQIDAPRAALTGFTGSYATVSISLVDKNTADDIGILTDVNGQTFLKSQSGVNSLANVSGFGDVIFSLNSGSGFPDAANLASFLITGTTGLWTSDAAVLINNAGGYSAAVRAFACTAPCTRPPGALGTGLVGR